MSPLDLHPLAPVPSLSNCSVDQQNKLTIAWARTASEFTHDATPDITSGSIESALVPLGDQVWCGDCRRGLMEKIKDVCDSWNNVKVSLALHFSEG
jgi:hypothetical protein